MDATLDGYEKIEYISDKISDMYGFCHFGFKTSPNIDEDDKALSECCEDSVEISMEDSEHDSTTLYEVKRCSNCGNIVE